MTSLFNSDCPS